MPFLYARKVKLLFGGTQLKQGEKTCFTPSLASYLFIFKGLEFRKCVTHQNYQEGMNYTESRKWCRFPVA